MADSSLDGPPSLRSWIIGELAQLLELPPERIKPSTRLRDQGLDSARALVLLAKLEEHLERTLPKTTPWRYPTVNALVAYLEGKAPKSTQEVFASEHVDEPIAIVGIGCRFPGATSPEAFWRLLCNGVDAITPVPPDRWDTEQWYDEDPNTEGKAATRWGGFLDQVDRFDASFFGISPREASEMDPQQRLFLEVAWEALERGGVLPNSLLDSSAAVFAGAMWNDWDRVVGDDPARVRQHSATGHDSGIIAGRLSYLLGARGPSMTINTACSSSLVAVHLAVQSLLRGECELALAGAVNLMLSPLSAVAMSKFGAMAPDGRCKAFDARANGYVRGEGVGVIVLEPLSRALRRGAQIYALVRGSAINNDGYSNGLTAPSGEAQEGVLARAWQVAGIPPAEVDYVETHGPGTYLGDPIEAEALGAVFARDDEREKNLVIGSVKTNLGHLEAAAGMAGLIKTALALHHGRVPPNLHFENPNPNIDFEQLQLRVPTSTELWPQRSGPRLAGVSSFGFGGTNAHVALSSAPGSLREQGISVDSLDSPPADAPKLVFVFPGQGGQWVGMGQGLLHREPSFRAAVEACDAALRPALGWSVLERMCSRAPLESPAVIQPMIFTIQVALCQTLAHYGVRPNAVLGQSMGEVAAAYVGSHLSLEDAARVIGLRAKLATERLAGAGAMAVVELGAEQLRHELPAGVTIAGLSSPLRTLVAGEPELIDAAAHSWDARGIRCTRVRVTYASHSPHVDPILDELGERLSEIAPKVGSVPWWSTATNTWAKPRGADAGYWVENLRAPFDLVQGVRQLMGSGAFFIEIGPHPVLLRAMQESGVEQALTLACMQREQDEYHDLHTLLEQLYALDLITPDPEPPATIVPLSARSFEGLAQTALTLRRFVAQRSDVGVADVAWTQLRHRQHHEHRAALVVNERAQLMRGLTELVQDSPGDASVEQYRGATVEQGKIAFVFPGQGGQWVGMGRDLLMSSSAFGETFDACDEALRPETGWSLHEVLLGSPKAPSLERIEVVQPTLWAVMVSLAAMWRSLGVEPDMVIGHSQGEIAAACVAGSLSLDDAARVVARRSRLLRRIAGQGAMAAVGLGIESLTEQLPDHLSLAVVNDRESSVVAGSPSAIDAWVEELRAQDIFARRVDVDIASHSPQIDALRGFLRFEFRELSPRQGQLPLLSTVFDDAFSGEQLDGAYWIENLRRPVRFDRALERAIAAGARTFVEVSPHPLLTGVIQRALSQVPQGGTVVGTLERKQPDERSLLGSLAQLFIAGIPFESQALLTPGRIVPLPTSPFERQRFWPPPSTSSYIGGGPRPTAGGGWVLALELDTRRRPWLRDHRVHGEMVVPGIAMIAWMSEVLASVPGSWAVVGAVLEAPLIFDGRTRDVQISARPEDGGRGYIVEVHAAKDKQWTRHARARLELVVDFHVGDMPELDTARAESAPYPDWALAGNQYGSTFQGIERFAREGDTLIVDLSLPEDETQQQELEQGLHPALLDAALQGLLIDAPIGQANALFSAGLHILHPKAKRLRALVSRPTGPLSGSVVLWDRSDGSLVARLDDVSLLPLDRSDLELGNPVQALRMDWRPEPFEMIATRERCVLVTDELTPLAERLSEQLREAGSQVDLVRIAELEQVLRSGPSAHVVALWPQSEGPADERALEFTHRALEQLRIIIEARATSTWVTYGANTINKRDEQLLGDPALGSLWGIGRVVQREHPELRHRLIDLADEASAPLLADAVLVDDHEDQVALVGGTRLVRRLMPGRDLPEADWAGGRVLITGGTGFVGRQLARWLITEGEAEQVTLVGRSAPSDAALEQVEDLGERVRFARCDVTKRDELRALLQGLPKLNAIIHGAMLLRDAPLMSVQPEQVAEVMAPKVKGALLLDELSRELELELDRFVLLSSMASVLGNPGQGVYAAANAFLDALAERRHASGLPAQSQSWGIWANQSQRLREQDRERFRRAGVRPLDAAEGVKWFGSAWKIDSPHLVLTPVDWDQFARSLTWTPMLLEELVTDFTLSPNGPRRATVIEDIPSLERAVMNELLDILGISDPSGFDQNLGFAAQGLDSLMAISLKSRLEQRLHVQLSATVAFNYPTFPRLVRHLAELKGLAKQIELVERQISPSDHAAIAVVGMACRFPGADSPEELWSLLLAGTDALSPIPRERFDIERWYDPDPSAPGRTYQREAGLVHEVDAFDNAFFQISPREAQTMDPQQGLLLEVGVDALEDAGLSVGELEDSSAGIFVGALNHDHAAQLLGRPDADWIDGFVASGTRSSVLAGRLSHFLGVHGPSLTVDTACSSSLTAIHLAVRSLRAGECELALAGGVNALLSPMTLIERSKNRMLSPTGRCRPFDADADGIAIGEGCGLVVLKRLSDAMLAGDRIRAVIRGSALNHDGRTSGLTVPSGLAQRSLLRSAIKEAEVRPEEIGYVEAHGTGTSLGDPIELEALGKAMRFADNTPLWIGSLKANLGHLESASGVAGFIKTVLTLEQQMLPPQLHFERGNPMVPWQESPLRVPTHATELDTRYAGVSSFGFSGTNVHVILERGLSPEEHPPSRTTPLLLLSARSPEALAHQRVRWAEYLERGEHPPLPDLCYTAAHRRGRHPWMLAAAGQDREQLIERLLEAPALPSQGQRPKLVFVFAGQGGAYRGMGRQLLEAAPEVRQIIEDIDMLVQSFGGPSVIHTLCEAELELTELAQPAIFALEVGLVTWLSTRGIRPDAVIGHSVGELAAAWACGALSLFEACNMLVMRASVMAGLRGGGAMLALAISAEEVAELGDPSITIAAINSPSSVVVAGPYIALSRVRAEFSSQGRFARWVSTEYAFHSHSVLPAAVQLQELAASIETNPPQLPLYSTVDGARREAVLDLDYWTDNLCNPVRFREAVAAAKRDMDAVFLELGPHPALQIPIIETLSESGLEYDQARSRVVPCLTRTGNSEPELAEAAGRLYALGVSVKLDALVPPATQTSLPSYPWQRKRHRLPPPAPRPLARTTGEPLVAPPGWAELTRLDQPRPTWEARPLRAGAPDAGALISLLLPISEGPLLDALMAASVDHIERVHVTRGREGVEVWADGGTGWRELLNANLGEPEPVLEWTQALEWTPSSTRELEQELGAQLGAPLGPAVVGVERSRASWRLTLNGLTAPQAFAFARALASQLQGGPRSLGGWGRLHGQQQLEFVATLTVTPTTIVMHDGSGRQLLVVESAQWDPCAIALPPLATIFASPAEDETAPQTHASLLSELRALPAGERHYALSDWVEREARQALLIEDELDRGVGLFALGMDSVIAVALTTALSEAIGARLPNTLIFEHPSVDALARAALAHVELEPTSSAPASRPSVARARAREQRELPPARSSQVSSSAELTHRDPLPMRDAGEAIAIVGLACRLPGAESPDAFWRMLEQGVDGVGSVPLERWDASEWTHEDPEHPGSMVSAAGAFLDEISTFDAAFFGISPREAERMDPQQRLLLEVGYEALEHAGWPSASLAGSRTGVFVGIGTEDFAQLKFHGGAAEDISAYDFTGTDLSVAAGRLSHTWGLEGPSMAVDTACSSSLVALHLAAQSLRLGECDRALVGGVNVMLSPELGVFLSRARAMSPSGRCHTFDASADGYVRGEGCVVLALRRLSDATREGERVLALLRGSAVRHDGHASGLTVPNPASQVAVIRDALANAQVDPSEVSMIEAHGTGTPLGDPIEVRALSEVFGGRDERLWLASHKTNLGHLEAAAGITGVLKVILAMRQGLVPPHLHLQQLNPDIELAPLHAQIPSRVEPWQPTSGRRLAGVSSFGISGTNAHVVIEQAPARVNEDASERVPRPEPRAGAWLLPLSGRTPSSLVARARQLAERVEAVVGEAELDDLALSLGAHRDHHALRLAVVGDRTQLAARLREAEVHEVPRRSRLVFVFAGQGSQRLGMVRELYAQQVEFRRALDELDAAFEPTLGWSLIDELHADESRARLDRVEVVQPLICAVQIALARTLEDWGLRPDGVVGHSMGEVAAAACAGGLELADAGRVIGLRSRLVAEQAPAGGMAVVELSREEAEAMLADEPSLSIAAVNGPQTALLAGPPHRLDALGQLLAERERFYRRVKVDYASHSPGMDPLIQPLRELLTDLRPRPTRLSMHSTVRGTIVEGEQLGPEYWGDNLRETVRFDEVVLGLLARGPVTFVEIGPHPLLGYGIKQWCAAQDSSRSVCLASLRHDSDDQRSLLELTGRLYERGHEPDWRALSPSGRLVELPSYPWDRQRHWPALRRARPVSHNWTIAEAGSEGAPALTIELADEPWLVDHRVGALCVVPGAAYLAWIHAALGSRTELIVRGLQIEAALTFEPGEAVQVQVICHPVEPGLWEAEILASRGGSWRRHAHARAAFARHESKLQPTLAQLRERCQTPLEGAALYRRLADAGLHYGPEFQGVVEVHLGARQALAELRKTPSAARGQALHPAWLDAAQHAIAPLLPPGRWLPAGMGALQIHAQLPERCFVYAELREQAADTVEALGDLFVFSDQGQLLAELSGLRLRLVEDVVGRADKLRIFEDRWIPSSPDLTESPSLNAAEPWLIFGSDTELTRSIADALRARGAVQIERIHALEHLDVATIAEARVIYLADSTPRSQWQPVQYLALDPVGPAQLVIVTRGAWAPEQRLPIDPGAHAAWGLGRTLRHEHPSWDVQLVDIEPWAQPLASIGAMLDQLARADDERELAFRDGQRWAGRLHPLPSPPPAPPRHVNVEGRSFELVAEQPGIASSLALREHQRGRPGPGELEIAVEAAALSLAELDAMSGASSEHLRLGLACTGRVVRSGPGVDGWSVGDPVIAMLEGGSLASHALVRASLVARRPHQLSPVEAVSVAGPFLVAFHALLNLAAVRAKQRVLIHEADQAVGLAALQIAFDLDAEVYATVRTPEALERLRARGCAGVWSSQEHAWSDELHRACAGEGVDVVLNTLPGEALRLGIEALRSGGRFVELGRTDIRANRRLGMEVFRKNLAFFAVDMSEPALLCTRTLGQSLRELSARIEAGRHQPLSLPSWPVNRSADALHELSEGTSGGCVALEFSGAALARERLMLPLANSAELGLFGGTWLISGGTGELGLRCAELLANAGAGRILLVGRTRPDAITQARIADIGARGCRIEFASCDLAVRSELKNLLASNEQDLEGIIHCAGVLDDALLRDLDAERVERVLQGKLDGARNLHELTLELPLMHFVLFSSLSATLGSPGQSAYAIANAYLDGLAAERRARGLPGLAIAWGAWAEVGLAARDQRRGARLARRGLPSLRPEAGDELLACLLAGETPSAHLSATPIDWPAYREAQAHVAQSPRFEALQAANRPSSSATTPPTASAPVESLESLLEDARTPRQRIRRLEAWITDRAARVLGVGGSTLARDQPLAELGLDSLMSLELRNQIQQLVPDKLPSTLLFTYPSVAALAEHLLALQGSAPAPAPVPDRTPPPSEQTLPTQYSGHNLDEITLDSQADAELAAALADLREDENDPLEGVSDDEVMAALLRELSDSP